LLRCSADLGVSAFEFGEAASSIAGRLRERGNRLDTRSGLQRRKPRLRRAEASVSLCSGVAVAARFQSCQPSLGSREAGLCLYDLHLKRGPVQLGHGVALTDCRPGFHQQLIDAASHPCRHNRAGLWAKLAGVDQQAGNVSPSHWRGPQTEPDPALTLRYGGPRPRQLARCPTEHQE